MNATRIVAAAPGSPEFDAIEPTTHGVVGWLQDCPGRGLQLRASSSIKRVVDEVVRRHAEADGCAPLSFTFFYQPGQNFDAETAIKLIQTIEDVTKNRHYIVTPKEFRLEDIASSGIM